ncbi:MAG: hypothetical protein MUD01_08650 [Chloroflexaceae bacterium]|jgi:hypothetical protein|nr:hypothetical protein [Chloroflexaceae bacterium]
MQRDNPTNAARAGQNRLYRGALPVRSHIAATAWLDGAMRWHDGAVAWETRRGLVLPNTALLERARFHLRRVANQLELARRVLADPQSWLARRMAQLAEATYFVGLPRVDVPQLAERAAWGDKAAMGQLVALLPVEARCHDRLPASPAATLLACGPIVTPLLRTHAVSNHVPPAGRALAALLLGALASTDTWQPLPAEASRWLHNAYAHGHEAGLPEDALVTLALLREPDGLTLARRFAQAQSSAGTLALPTSLLRELVTRVAAEGLVVLAEAVAAAAPLLSALFTPAEALATVATWQARQKLAARQQRQWAHYSAELVRLLHNYLRVTPEAATVQAWASFVYEMRDLVAPHLPRCETLCSALAVGLQLAPSLQLPYLQLLATWQQKIWNRDNLPEEAQQQGWLNRRWQRYGQPICLLLKRSRDAQLVQQALEKNLYRQLSWQQFAEPAMYHWLLLVLARFPQHERELICDLAALVGRFPSLASAQATLRPFWQVLLQTPASVRTELCRQVVLRVSDTRAEAMRVLPRIIRHLPAISESLQQTSLTWHTPLLPGLIWLEERYPEHAADWLVWVLAQIPERLRTNQALHTSSLEDGFILAVTLSGGNAANFQRLLRAILDHEPETQRFSVPRSCHVLQRLPGLCETLAQLLPQQPQRCVRLIEQLGLVARLDTNVTDTFAAFELVQATAPFATIFRSADEDWANLLRLDPALDGLAAAYVQAQWLRGADMGLPAGVRHALEQPAKLAREAAHLAMLAQQKPEQPGLAMRLASLQARLADEATLWEAAVEEAGERLVQITAEARLAAAEQLLQDWLRKRLHLIAGPLPPDLMLDADLANAVLIDAHVDANRKLLRQLLRAHLAGERAWREALSGNAAFLQQLAARGVDVAAWLAPNPASYRCAGAVGGRIHIYLEGSALRVLQMGNYFNTCLGVGGINAFSTVANACELNKRVIYVQDGSGRIVGRKLIAISSEWGLLGYRTYINAAPADQIERLLQRYVREFAARCGLPLADTGEVPRLVAAEWYDDGEEAWVVAEGEGEVSLAKAQSSQRSADERPAGTIKKCR